MAHECALLRFLFDGSNHVDVTGPFEILLRILSSIAQLAYVPGRKMTAPPYKSVSAIGNRVTLVICQGNMQTMRERRSQLRSIIRIIPKLADPDSCCVPPYRHPL
jgi:hypothetical protein